MGEDGCRVVSTLEVVEIWLGPRFGLWNLVLSALGLWNLVLSALRIVESGFVCPSGVEAGDGGWLCPPFGIVGSGFVRPSDCGIWFCLPFGCRGG